MTVQRESSLPLFTTIEKVIATTIAVAIVTGIILLLLWRFVFLTIRAGHVGVLFSLLGGGTVKESVMHEGIAMKWPWNRIFLFEIRTQHLPLEVIALSAEGMSVIVEGAVFFRPKRIDTPEVLTTLGKDYSTRIILPITRGSIRELITQFNSNEIYSVDHKELQDLIIAEIRAHVLTQNIIIDDLLLTRISLPPEIAKAIDRKLASEQRAVGYEFLIEAEKREAERLRIQAIGLQNFYAIVSESLNDTVLTWRGIEATVQLSQSNNAKIVIVGGGKDQLPLILGSDVANLPNKPEPIAPVDHTRFQLPDLSSLPRFAPNPAAQIMRESGSRIGFSPPGEVELPASRSGAGGILEGSDSKAPDQDTGTAISSGVESDVDQQRR